MLYHMLAMPRVMATTPMLYDPAKDPLYPEIEYDLVQKDDSKCFLLPCSCRGMSPLYSFLLHFFWNVSEGKDLLDTDEKRDAIIALFQEFTNFGEVPD
eukprot:750448-Hanusia_phi.AAC.3